MLGSTKKALGGFSAMQMLPHTGFIYYCDVVQKQAHEYRKKAARMVAAKCALAARVDSYYDERSKGATVGIGKQRAVEEERLIVGCLLTTGMLFFIPHRRVPRGHLEEAGKSTRAASGKAAKGASCS